MKKQNKKMNQKIILIIIETVVVVVLAGLLIWKLFGENTSESDAALADLVNTESTESVGDSESDTEYSDPDDPESNGANGEVGEEIDVTSLLSAGTVEETEDTTYGIDVAKYQGTIDWSKVAASGIDFAMVRVGYRTKEDGRICEDSNARYNLQEATANGIKVGAYFFSTAVSKEEAIEEADWVADLVSGYSITYPIAYNSEGFNDSSNRQCVLTIADRTAVAEAFMDEIYAKGYTPMFYAAKSELLGDQEWLTSDIETTYKIWVAQYSSQSASKADYTGVHAMWQYTNQGSVDGIKTAVDIDIAYFGYGDSAGAKSDGAAGTASADVEADANMSFTSVNETVTAKDTTNLRNIPSQGDGAQVVATLSNGETATRTGTSASGWSRLDYNGQTVYAVSNYLTTDLSYAAPAQSSGEDTTGDTSGSTTDGSGSGDGIKTKFTACNDQVTAKSEVNLRALPSVTNPDATVLGVLHNGEVVTRTGVNNEYGWSRVECNGVVMYCISSYLTGA